MRNIITDVVSLNSNSDYHIRCFEASNFLGNRMADFLNEVDILRKINIDRTRALNDRFD